MFVHKRLKSCRKGKNLSLTGVMYGIYEYSIKRTPETLRNWENGDSTPDANELEAFAKFYEKPLQYFFD